MYLKNPYYLELMQGNNITYEVLIKTNTDRLNTKVIKSIKYDLAINNTGKLNIGGVFGASINLELINFNNLLDNISFTNKEFEILFKVKNNNIYTVNSINKEKVEILNNTKVKNITSMWIPIGKFYIDDITKKENRGLTLKMVDRTKLLENNYIPRISFPATFNEIVSDISTQLGITVENYNSINSEILVNNISTTYTFKELLGYISECECGYFTVNRYGNLQLLRFNSNNLTKNINKYKEFKPAEDYITIKKVKYGEMILGEEAGHTLELNNSNPLITDNVVQNIYNNIKDLTYMPYSLKLIRGDIAQDILDNITITNTNNNVFNSYIFNNSWTFNGALSQNLSAKGESTLRNTYSTKGIINKTLERIQKELIPNTLEKAIENATNLLTEFNGGYVIKKDGELFISDNEDLEKAVKVWRWNINGLGYSSTGVRGPYGTAITMDGSIVANYITSGSMTADRINGGTLKIGGINNTNGEIQVVDTDGNELVKINLEGITLSNGTKLIGGNGVLSLFQYNSSNNRNGDFLGFFPDYTVSEVKKNQLKFNVNIPDNFMVLQAWITLVHNPVHWSGTNENGTASNFWGKSSKLKLYKREQLNVQYNAYCFSELAEVDESILSEITGSLGNNGFTAQTPTNNSHLCEIVNSADFAGFVTNGINVFILQSDENIPNLENDFVEQSSYAKTGICTAVLNVIGYIS